MRTITCSFGGARTVQLYFISRASLMPPAPSDRVVLIAPRTSSPSALSYVCVGTCSAVGRWVCHVIRPQTGRGLMLRRATLAVLCWTSDRCFTMWLSAFLLTLLLSLGESGPAGRIVKGIEAQPHSWPSQLSLRLGDSHICGAVVLNENFALSAAHCIDIVGTGAQNFSVVCGAHDLRDPDSNWQVSEAETLIKHEAYDANGYGFPDDIGLIRLSTPLVMNEVCQPATLPPDDSNDYANTESYITGWGRIGGNDRAANVLKQASINTLTNRKCSEFWWLFSPVRGTHICVHDNTLTHGACNGDSGGPLFSPENTLGDMTVTGLTSFGMANCDTRYPSVYTRVSKYLDWIRSNAQ